MVSHLAVSWVSCVFFRIISQVDFQTTELWADVMFHTDIAVYARESTMLYGVMMFTCEDL